LRLELRASVVDVFDVERDRVRVAVELLAEGLGLQDLQREGAGLELAAGHFPVLLGLLEAEDLAVEALCRVEVGNGDVGEVDAGDSEWSSAHAAHLCASRTRRADSSPETATAGDSNAGCDQALQAVQASARATIGGRPQAVL